jgi:hypothetical protein
MQFMPKKCELNVDAPDVPENYGKPYNIDTQTRQTTIGNKQYLKMKNKSYNYSDASYKSIARAPHVSLNLLYTDVTSHRKSGILKIGISTRIQEKHVTYIYYKPING